LFRLLTLTRNRQAKGVHTEEVDMADSQISIVQSKTTNRLQFVIASKDGYTTLSQECRYYHEIVSDAC